MQPSPTAETSKLLFPSLRFCIISPGLRNASASGQRKPKHRSPTLCHLPISMKFLPDSLTAPELNIFASKPLRPIFRTKGQLCPGFQSRLRKHSSHCDHREVAVTPQDKGSPCISIIF